MEMDSCLISVTNTNYIVYCFQTLNQVSIDYPKLKNNGLGTIKHDWASIFLAVNYRLIYITNIANKDIANKIVEVT